MLTDEHELSCVASSVMIDSSYIYVDIVKLHPGIQHPASAVGGVRGTLHHQLHPLQLARHPRQPSVRGPRGHRTGQSEHII